MIITQRLVGPSKQLKHVQIIQMEHNIIKNRKWSKAKQLAFYKRGQGFELEATVEQIQVVDRAGTAGLRDRRADHSPTLPPTQV